MLMEIPYDQLPTEIQFYERQATAGHIGKVVCERVDTEGITHTMTSYLPRVSLVEMAEAQEAVERSIQE